MTTVTKSNLLVSRTTHLQGTEKEACKVIFVPMKDDCDSFLILYDSDSISATRMCNAINAILKNHMPGNIVDHMPYYQYTSMIWVKMAGKAQNPVTATKVFNRKLVELLAQTTAPTHLTGLKPDKTFKLNTINDQDWDFCKAVMDYLDSLCIEEEELRKVESILQQQATHMQDYLYVYVSRELPPEGLYLAQKTKPLAERVRVYTLADNNLWIWV